MGKYLEQQPVMEIFNKCDVDYIETSDDLIPILSLCILIYKVKVFQIKNSVEGQNGRVEKTRILKKDFKPIATYLSFWILKNYGKSVDEEQGIYEITITKEFFAKNMH